MARTTTKFLASTFKVGVDSQVIDIDLVRRLHCALQDACMSMHIDAEENQDRLLFSRSAMLGELCDELDEAFPGESLSLEVGR